MTFNSLSNTVYANMVSSGFTSTNQTYTSSTFPLANYTGVATNAINEAHSLGVKPLFVRAVFECITAQGNYLAGDEVDASSSATYQGSFSANLVSFGASSTNVFATMSGPNVNIYIQTTNGVTALIPSRWRLKVYARP
jgi:hypothetical protein